MRVIVLSYELKFNSNKKGLPNLVISGNIRSILVISGNMLFPPKYTLTTKISQLLSSIESSKEVINSVAIPPEIEINIRRSSTLKSSLFSAKIEGNELTIDQLTATSSKDQRKVEVFNILKALNLIQQRKARDIMQKDLLQFHQIVMQGLIERSDLGKFRAVSNAIFNSAGIAVYLPPPPKQVINLVEKLLRYANADKENLVPVKAILAHYCFEKIHPFLDGNGRVGRLLLQAVLSKGGYDMKGLMALEEKLEQSRAIYYRMLEEPEKDLTDYVEFMLECMSTAAMDARNLVLQKEGASPEEFLLPRRTEILNIIKDQKLVSFDQIRRRFIGVNERTLRYDLKKLQDAGFIRKLGETKGVFYEATNK